MTVPGPLAAFDPAEVLLLRMAAGARHLPEDELAAMDEAGWVRLAGRAEELRVAAAFHVRAEQLGWPLSEDVAVRFARDHRQWALKSLAHARELARLGGILAGAELPFLALKGAALALTAYGSPAERPMRDIDLLLGYDDALAAQALLLEHGWREAKGSAVMPPGTSNHLRALEHGESGVMLEIHYRVSASGRAGDAEITDLLWGEASNVRHRGALLAIPGPEALMLHQVEHATLQHLFDNGPQALADWRAMLDMGVIDWAKLVSSADTAGLGRALDLAMACLALCGGCELPGEIRGRAGAAMPQVSRALRLMLVRRDDPLARNMARRSRAPGGNALGLSWALAKAFSPTAEALAEIAGCGPDDPRRWLAYPAWAGRRAGIFLRARNDTRLAAESRRGDAMAKWLRTGD